MSSKVSGLRQSSCPRRRFRPCTAALALRFSSAWPPADACHLAPCRPILAENHTVVCPDLRGFGRSSIPEDTPDQAGSSKRANAVTVSRSCAIWVRPLCRRRARPRKLHRLQDGRGNASYGTQPAEPGLAGDFFATTADPRTSLHTVTTVAGLYLCREVFLPIAIARLLTARRNSVGHSSRP